MFVQFLRVVTLSSSFFKKWLGAHLCCSMENNAGELQCSATDMVVVQLCYHDNLNHKTC